MPEEAQPFLDLCEVRDHADRTYQLRTPAGRDVILLISGVGMVNAAVQATVALTSSPGIDRVISAGTAGGIGAGVSAGDVIVGEDYRHIHADATAFGYQRGQVPGMPERYVAAADLTAAAGATTLAGPVVRLGSVISSDAFVTADLVGDIRADFPGALSVDMESSAVAQTCYLRDVPFVSIRCVSDLCATDDGDEFLAHVDDAAETSARVVIDVIDHLAPVAPSVR